MGVKTPTVKRSEFLNKKVFQEKEGGKWKRIEEK
jgi:hypothetical protein